MGLHTEKKGQRPNLQPDLFRRIWYPKHPSTTSWSTKASDAVEMFDHSSEITEV